MSSLKRLFAAICNFFKAGSDQASATIGKVSDKILTIDIIEKAEMEFKEQVKAVNAYGDTLTGLMVTINAAKRALEESKADLANNTEEYEALCLRAAANPTPEMKRACKYRLSAIRDQKSELADQEKEISELEETYQLNLSTVNVAKFNLRTRELKLKNVRSKYERYKSMNQLNRFTIAAAGAEDIYFNKLNELVDFEEAKAKVEKDIASTCPSVPKKHSLADNDAELDAIVEEDIKKAAEEGSKTNTP